MKKVIEKIGEVYKDYRNMGGRFDEQGVVLKDKINELVERVNELYDNKK